MSTPTLSLSLTATSTSTRRGSPAESPRDRTRLGQVTAITASLHVRTRFRLMNDTPRERVEVVRTYLELRGRDALRAARPRVWEGDLVPLLERHHRMKAS